MRPSVASPPTEAERTAFADAVAYYLTQQPRQLPSRYLYDELGSSLFEAICRLPWYHITRSEQALLEAHSGEILGHLRALSTVVELGPGSGEKLVTLMATQPTQPTRNVTVHLVDVSRAALDTSAAALARWSSSAVVLHHASYEAGLAAVRETSVGGQTLVVFLGSNIGNFDPPGADALLRSIRASLGRDDALLLGTDLVKPEAELLLAYDDPLGVTAAFNRNLLMRINRELGGDFDAHGFAHRAVWNASASRLEMHLVSRRQQRVQVRAAGLDVTFNAGETIWTESSYKYRIEDLAPILDRAGFRTVGQWQGRGFALTLAQAS